MRETDLTEEVQIQPVAADGMESPGGLEPADGVDGAPPEVVDEWEAAAPDGADATGSEVDGSPSWDVPEQIDPVLTPRNVLAASSHVHPEPEPEPEQKIPRNAHRRLPRAARPPTGSMMGLGSSAVFYSHEVSAKGTGGIEVLEQRRRQIEESAKDRETFALLEDVLAEHWLTSGLTQDVLAALVDSMVRRDVQPGQKVVSRGEEGTCLLILGSGQCEVTNADADTDDSDDEQTASVAGRSEGSALSRLLETGDCMGGIMLVMPGHLHVATMRAISPSVIWCLERTHFQDLVHSRTAAALQIRMELLQGCPWLSSLDEEQLGRIAAVGRLHCCPVGARSVFDRAPPQARPRCRYVLEEPDEGPDDFDWAGAPPSLPQEPVYDYGNSKGVLPTAGSVRPLRPQALTPTVRSPTTVLVERISEGHGHHEGDWNTNGRELHLLAISGAAFSWLLGEAVCAELQEAISHEYPITPEEAEAELIREMEREEEALTKRIKAAKEQAKGPPRPSAAAMSMASALASYGATPVAVKSSINGRSRVPRSGRGSKKKNGGSRALPVVSPVSQSSSLSFHAPGQLGVTSAVGIAQEARKRMLVHQLAEKEMERRVEQVNLDSLEFFTPSHLTQTSSRLDPLSTVDSDEEMTTAPQDEKEGRLHFKDGRLAYQSPSHHGQDGRYLYVRPTEKRALSALGAERKWLHSLRVWAELPSNPGVLALVGAGESKSHLYTLTTWKGGETLSAAVARNRASGTDHCNRSRAVAKVRDPCVFRLTRKAVAFYTVQIIGALDMLHTQRVVYRSLTPASLLLDNEGHIQLGSFGLAKRLGASTSGVLSPSTLLICIFEYNTYLLS
eukprot:COSAG02_NODE_162_length_32474_cov_13.222511_9_plen_844_part_00